MTDADRIFKAMGDPARVRILEFLRNPDAGCCTFEGQICACDIEQLLKLSQATISHHMRLLIDAGLVTATKRGRWMHYTLRTEAFTRTAEWLQGFARASGKDACAPACMIP